MDICIFGAGAIGRTAAIQYKAEGENILCFIDNDSQKWGKSIYDIPIISFEHYVELKEDHELVVCCTSKYEDEIKKQLYEAGIYNFLKFDMTKILGKERIVSYSYPTENEDIILYHVLKDETDIFYIDIGCNEPTIGSVTKLLYEKRNAHGINVDIENSMIELTNLERTRDINLCIGVGEKEGIAKFCTQGEFGGLSTMIKDNEFVKNKDYKEIRITTLERLCDEYILKGQSITFLKIDVEGMEKSVLNGANFTKYRPKIVIVESTLPCTDIPSYQDWEYILHNNNYHFVYEHGVNRYYVSDENSYLDEKFVPWPELAIEYCVFHADLMYCY